MRNLPPPLRAIGRVTGWALLACLAEACLNPQPDTLPTDVPNAGGSGPDGRGDCGVGPCPAGAGGSAGSGSNSAGTGGGAGSGGSPLASGGSAGADLDAGVASDADDVDSGAADAGPTEAGDAGL